MIEKSIKYMHATMGIPSKDTWFKAIRARYYSLMVTLCRVNKFFAESEKTKKRHETDKKGIQLKIIKRAYQRGTTNSTTTKGMGCDDQNL